MSWRRCSPSNAIASAARLGLRARGGEVRAAPDDGQDPAAVRAVRAAVAVGVGVVPAWKTSAPVAAAASSPSIGSPRRGASG